jgi:membrane fusion protein, heavy metal efflux system
VLVGRNCFLHKIVLKSSECNLLLLSLLIFAAMLSGCNSDRQCGAEFTIPDSLFGKIMIDTLVPEPVALDLKVNLVFDENKSKIIKVFPVVNGQIFKVNVKRGQFVHKGEILAIQKSSQQMQLRRKFFIAQNNYSIAEQNLLAAAEMYKKGHYSGKKLKEEEFEKKRLENELNKIRQEFEYSKAKKDKIEWVNIVAPVSGFIIRHNPDAGLALNNIGSHSIFTISPNKNISFSANADNKTLAELKNRNSINFISDLWPGKIFKASVEVVSKKEKAQTILLNPSDTDFFSTVKLPGSFTLSFFSRNKKNLGIPLKAVIFDENKPFVLVYNGNKKFNKCELSVTKKSRNRYYVEKGLKNGDKIITQGQQILYFQQ